MRRSALDVLRGPSTNSVGMIECHSEQEGCAGIFGEMLSLDASRGYRVGSVSWRVGIKHRDRGEGGLMLQMQNFPDRCDRGCGDQQLYLRTNNCTYGLTIVPTD